MEIPEKNVKIEPKRPRWLWVFPAFLLLFGIYAAISYLLPYMQWRSLKSITYPRCVEDDVECVEKTLALWQESFDIQAPVFRVLKSDGLAQALRHPDGTACFLITDPAREASPDEMKKWLDSFGAERFNEMMPLFMRLRYFFEKKYHPPNPLKARIEAVAKLKWHHLPFGKEWRDYNFAQRFWNWSLESPPSEPELTPTQKQDIFSQFAEDGYLFQDQNILRLLARSKAEIEGGKD